LTPEVICLPGSVAPAAQRYAPLKAQVGDRAHLHLKDLEVYTGDTPPPDYGVDMELAALERFAESLNLDRFHLIGYSGGGFLALAFAGTRPERLLSLAVFEPAMIPGPMTPAEQAVADTLRTQLAGLEGPEFMSAFVRLQLKPGVPPPPPPQQPAPGMPKRPAGIAAMMRSFFAYRFERDALRAARFPVYFGYGDLTHNIEAVKASILAGLFADVRVKRYAGVHHFVAADQIYTAEHARALKDLWARASGPEFALQ
jgi:pimeloyl-ACP methyl ester carboxylesterase